MSILFSPKAIGRHELPNRMIRAASHEGLADARGRPTEEQFRFYKGFVEGGIGLVITGYARVLQAGRSALYRMTMIDSDDLVPAHREMVERLHAIGGRIVLQIAHCGRQTWSTETRQPLKAPSAIPCGFYGEKPEEMTEADIAEVVRGFGDAARRAKDAGYDGVQVHGAHGYLLSSFLARRSNRRKDRWGGDLSNRFRIVGDVLKAVRDAVGPGYPVLIKLNTEERVSGGITPDECVETARRVEQTGCCDAIELSCGTNEAGFVMTRGAFPANAMLRYLRPFCHMSPPYRFVTKRLVMPAASLFQPRFREGYNLATAARVKRSIKLPVVTVGGMRERAFMEAAIDQGHTDFCSMARPLILEPDLPNKFRSGRTDRARCDNCNACVVATDTQSIRCHNTALLRQLAQPARRIINKMQACQGSVPGPASAAQVFFSSLQDCCSHIAL
ncbi:MAG: NADH:flavin oxidoreductase [Acidobacteriota bacterium]